MEPYFVEEKGRFKLEICQDEYISDCLFDAQIPFYAFNQEYRRDKYFTYIQDNWLDWLIAQLPADLSDALGKELNDIDNMSLTQQTPPYADFQKKVLTHIRKEHYLVFIEERGSTNYNSLHFTTTDIPNNVEFLALISKNEARQLVGDSYTNNSNNISNAESLEKKMTNYLRGDLDTLESIYNGNVWSYSITDMLTDDVVESCSGFIETDPIAEDSYILSEARSYVAHWLSQTDRKNACVELEIF